MPENRNDKTKRNDRNKILSTSPYAGMTMSRQSLCDFQPQTSLRLPPYNRKDFTQPTPMGAPPCCSKRLLTVVSGPDSPEVDCDPTLKQV